MITRTLGLQRSLTQWGERPTTAANVLTVKYPTAFASDRASIALTTFVGNSDLVSARTAKISCRRFSIRSTASSSASFSPSLKTALIANRRDATGSLSWISRTAIGHDKTTDFPEVGYPFIRDVYRLYRHGDRVHNVHLPAEYHDFGPSKRRALYEFFARHLRMPLIPEAAGSIAIETPGQMEVFSAKRPFPPESLQGSEAIARAFRSLIR